jgi:hypothetical protein
MLAKIAFRTVLFVTTIEIGWLRHVSDESALKRPGFNSKIIKKESVVPFGKGRITTRSILTSLSTVELSISTTNDSDFGEAEESRRIFQFKTVARSAFSVVREAGSR